ncbi:MAG TPA: alkaline phosphatase family protein [Chitinophagaceae bacterium]|nr:alkaline phosphatase family protein [Chitinophagaceae bacterium]
MKIAVPVFPSFYKRACLVFVCILCCSAIALAQAGKRKTVFIIVDGIPADVIEKLPLPQLASIAQQGGYTRSYVGGKKGTYSQTPTISAVGYNSVLTGVWVNKHNVWDNDIAAPNYHYPTIFRLFKEQYPAGKTAIFSSWQDNRTKLVGDKLPATGNLPIDISYDGLEHDSLHFPHDKQRDFMQRIDDSVSARAAAVIRSAAPDLSWVYLEHTDDMGHMYGDSPQFYNAVVAADRRIGEIWKAIQFRQQQYKEDWLIIVTTDHGRDAATGKGHGGQSDRERDSWIYTNAKNLNEQFHAPQAAAVDIMPSIARFMKIALPQNIAREVDGTPFIGPLSFITPSCSQQQQKLIFQWKATAPGGHMKIWASTTNQFNTGGKDEYKLMGSFPLQAQEAVIDLARMPSSFYKIVLEAPGNTANCWLDDKGNQPMKRK